MIFSKRASNLPSIRPREAELAARRIAAAPFDGTFGH